METKKGGQANAHSGWGLNFRKKRRGTRSKLFTNLGASWKRKGLGVKIEMAKGGEFSEEDVPFNLQRGDFQEQEEE